MFQERCKPGRSCWLMLVLFVLAVLGPSGASGMEVSMEAAAEIVLRDILGSDTASIRVEVNVIPLPADAIVVNPADLELSEGETGSYFNPFQESWFFLIDDYPNANWGHPCRYVWVDTETGNYKVVDEDFPPVIFPQEIEQCRYIFGMRFPWEVGVEKTSWGEIKARYKQ